MSADPLYDAENAYEATMEQEYDIYTTAVNAAAVLHQTSTQTARQTYYDALDAADLLYNQSVDVATAAIREASAQARHLRDMAVDAHRHAITDPGHAAPAAITDGTITGTIVKPRRRPRKQVTT